MFSKTTIAAIRLLIHLGSIRGSKPTSLRHVAEHLGESPTYMAKVSRHLVKAGILRAHRGVAGGAVLGDEPGEISLLRIVEACQGQIIGDFCSESEDLRQTCAFHQASSELHEATIRVLASWTLADLLRRPAPACGRSGKMPCLIQTQQGLRLTVRGG